MLPLSFDAAARASILAPVAVIFLFFLKGDGELEIEKLIIFTLFIGILSFIWHSIFFKLKSLFSNRNHGELCKEKILNNFIEMPIQMGNWAVFTILSLIFFDKVHFPATNLPEFLGLMFAGLIGKAEPINKIS
jgi:hypothetical protein